MKNTISTLIKVIVFSAILTYPLGRLYESVTHASRLSFFSDLDPNNLLSGFTISLSLLIGFLSGASSNFLMLAVNGLILLYLIWLGATYDIYFVVVATVIGYSCGLIYKLLRQRTLKH